MGTLPRFFACDSDPWTRPAANEAPLYVRCHDCGESQKTEPQVLEASAGDLVRLFSVSGAFALPVNYYPGELKHVEVCATDLDNCRVVDDSCAPHTPPPTVLSWHRPWSDGKIRRSLHGNIGSTCQASTKVGC